MQTTKVPISSINLNPNNPRVIKDYKFEKLVRSIREFPKMLELRPIVVNEDNVILGGNMRYRACVEAGLDDVYIVQAKDLTEEQQKEFIVKDNVSFGDWDFEVLANEWDIKDLEDWSVKVPTIKDTELLSGLEYKSMYYEPKDKPELKLEWCLNLDKFNEKVKALDEFDLTDKQKETLKTFAYRFIKIDFESVANYYYFNASDEEQKAIERLRLVLTDDGVSGFVEDDLLRIYNFTDEGFEL